MQTQSTKRQFVVVVEFENGTTREVKVKAADESKALDRAFKFHPSAVDAKVRDA